MALNQASPAQMVAQVAGGHAVEAEHPFLAALAWYIAVSARLSSSSTEASEASLSWSIAMPSWQGMGINSDQILHGKGQHRLDLMLGRKIIDRSEREHHAPRLRQFFPLTTKSPVLSLKLVHPQEE